MKCNHHVPPSTRHDWPKNWLSHDTTKPKAFPIGLILNTPTTKSCFTCSPKWLRPHVPKHQQQNGSRIAFCVCVMHLVLIWKCFFTKMIQFLKLSKTSHTFSLRNHRLNRLLYSLSFIINYLDRGKGSTNHNFLKYTISWME
jgi:hypothetical protein